MATEDHLPLQLQVMHNISINAWNIFRRAMSSSSGNSSTSRWHQDQDKFHLVVAGRQVQDDGEQPRRGAAAPAADDEVLVLGLLLQPPAQC